MLKPPYTHYSRIYTYHLENCSLPALDDPDLIGMWEEDGKTIVIFHQPKEELIRTLCHKHGCRLFYQADLDYKDWEMGRKVVPFTVGPLTVAPVWDQDEADIRLDPSVVFGNGFHPSTRLCLESLVGLRAQLPKNFSALDLGCGTGLLSIGAARLGAASVTAVDHNLLACSVTRQNAAYNKVSGIIRVDQVELKTGLPETKVDLIMANLHHELLSLLFKQQAFWQAGLYILAGFMPDAEADLLASLPTSPPQFLDRGRQGKWCVWVLGRAT